MKLSLTTTISMASIVAAGAAAYAINVNVLEAPAAANPPAAAVVVPVNSVAMPESGSASASSTRSPITVEEIPVSAQTTKFQVGTAGAVLVTEGVNGINVASISPAPGWTSEPARVESDGTVKIHFVSGTERVEFTARKANGKIVTSVMNELRRVTSPEPGNPGVRGEPSPPAVGATPGSGTMPSSGATPGSAPAPGAKPQIPTNLRGDDDDDDDEDDDDDDHGERDHDEDDD